MCPTHTMCLVVSLLVKRLSQPAKQWPVTYMCTACIAISLSKVMSLIVSSLPSCHRVVVVVAAAAAAVVVVGVVLSSSSSSSSSSSRSSRSRSSGYGGCGVDSECMSSTSMFTS